MISLKNFEDSDNHTIRCGPQERYCWIVNGPTVICADDWVPPKIKPPSKWRKKGKEYAATTEGISYRNIMGDFIK